MSKTLAHRPLASLKKGLPDEQRLALLVEHRQKLIEDLGEVNEWLKLRRVPGLNAFEHGREQATRQQRRERIQKELRDLNPELKALNIKVSQERDRKVHAPVVKEFYLAVLELEESGVDIGEKLRGLVKGVEARLEADQESGSCG